MKVTSKKGSIQQKGGMLDGSEQKADFEESRIEGQQDTEGWPLW